MFYYNSSRRRQNYNTVQSVHIVFEAVTAYVHAVGIYSALRVIICLKVAILRNVTCSLLLNSIYKNKIQLFTFISIKADLRNRPSTFVRSLRVLFSDRGLCNLRRRACLLRES